MWAFVDPTQRGKIAYLGELVIPCETLLVTTVPTRPSRYDTQENIFIVPFALRRAARNANSDWAGATLVSELNLLHRSGLTTSF
jgi:hypothetical protein